MLFFFADQTVFFTSLIYEKFKFRFKRSNNQPQMFDLHFPLNMFDKELKT
jgi:hypothetical protein